MTDALAGCRAKLDRANEHLDTLKTEVRREPVGVEVLPEHDFERGEARVEEVVESFEPWFR